jgi:DNA replication protein DnaC
VKNEEARVLDTAHGAALSSLGSAKIATRVRVPEAVEKYAYMEKLESHPSMLPAIRAAKTFISRCGKAPGLLFCGPSGTFKTTLAWTVLLELRNKYLDVYQQTVDEFIAEKNPARCWYSIKQSLPEWRVQFITGAELYARLLPSGNDQDRTRIIDEFSFHRRGDNFNVLIWDDIEKFKPGEYVGSLIHAIVDARYRHGLAIIATSNLNPDELCPILGEAVVRRLGDMNTFIELFSHALVAGPLRGNS